MQKREVQKRIEMRQQAKAQAKRLAQTPGNVTYEVLYDSYYRWIGDVVVLGGPVAGSYGNYNFSLVQGLTTLTSKRYYITNSGSHDYVDIPTSDLSETLSDGKVLRFVITKWDANKGIVLSLASDRNKQLVIQETNGKYNLALVDSPAEDFYFIYEYNSSLCEDEDQMYAKVGGKTIFVYINPSTKAISCGTTPASESTKITLLFTSCEHSLAARTVIRNATCLGEGQIHFACPDCEDEDDEIVPALGHNWVDGECANCHEAHATYNFTSDLTAKNTIEKYILVSEYDGKLYAMTGTPKSTSLQAVEVSKEDGKIVNVSNDDVIFFDNQDLILSQGNFTSDRYRLKIVGPKEGDDTPTLPVKDGDAIMIGESQLVLDGYNTYFTLQDPNYAHYYYLPRIYKALKPACSVHEHLSLCAEVPATCTTTGVREHYECDECGTAFKDAATTEAYTLAEMTIPTTKHDLVFVPGVKPTCMAAGIKDLYKCKDCGGVFIDAEGTEASMEVFLLENATGHDFENNVCKHCGLETDLGNLTFTTNLEEGNGPYILANNVNGKMYAVGIHNYAFNEYYNRYANTLTKVNDTTYKGYASSFVLFDDATLSEGSVRLSYVPDNYSGYDIVSVGADNDAVTFPSLTLNGDGTLTAVENGKTYGVYLDSWASSFYMKDDYTSSYYYSKFTLMRAILPCVHEHVAFIAGSPADCESEGVEAVYQCIDCNKMFFDADCKNYCPDEQDRIIPALGHLYDEEGECALCHHNKYEEYSKFTLVRSLDELADPCRVIIVGKYQNGDEVVCKAMSSNNDVSAGARRGVDVGPVTSQGNLYIDNKMIATARSYPTPYYVLRFRYDNGIFSWDKDNMYKLSAFNSLNENTSATLSRNACLPLQNYYNPKWNITIDEDGQAFLSTSVSVYNRTQTSFMQFNNSFKGGNEVEASNIYIFKEVCKHEKSSMIEVAYDATCEDIGLTKFYYCKDCCSRFNDIEATEPTDVASHIINPIGHNYEDGICTECHRNHGTHRYTLENNERTKTVVAKWGDKYYAVLNETTETGLKVVEMDFDDSGIARVDNDKLKLVAYPYNYYTQIVDGQYLVYTPSDIPLAYYVSNHGDYNQRLTIVDGSLVYIPDTENPVELIYAYQLCNHDHATEIAAKAADCTHFGNAHYWFCEDCGMRYSDIENEVIANVTSIAPLRHHYEKGSTTCTNCGKQASRYKMVTKDGEFTRNYKYIIVGKADGRTFVLGSDPNDEGGDFIDLTPGKTIEVTPNADGTITINNGDIDEFYAVRIKRHSGENARQFNYAMLTPLGYSLADQPGLYYNDFNVEDNLDGHYLEDEKLTLGDNEVFTFDFWRNKPWEQEELQMGAFPGNYFTYNSETELDELTDENLARYEADYHMDGNSAIICPVADVVLFDACWHLTKSRIKNFPYDTSLIDEPYYRFAGVNEAQGSDPNLGTLSLLRQYDPNAECFSVYLYYCIDDPMVHFDENTGVNYIAGRMTPDEVSEAITDIIVHSKSTIEDDPQVDYGTVTNIDLSDVVFNGIVTDESMYIIMKDAQETAEAAGGNLDVSENVLVTVPSSLYEVMGTNIINNGVCENLALTDAEDFRVSSDFVANEFNYARTLTSRWGTLVLPVDIEVPDGLVAQKVTEVDIENSTITFAEVSALEADVPVIIRSTSGSGEKTFSLTGNQFSVKAPDAEKVKNMTFRGTYVEIPKGKATGKYVLTPNNEFVPAGDEAWIPAFRAYLEVESDVAETKVIRINFDESTGIMSADGKDLLKITICDGGVNLLGANGTTVTISNVEGKLMRNIMLGSSEEFIPLPTGTYIINKSKVLIK